MHMKGLYWMDRSRRLCSDRGRLILTSALLVIGAALLAGCAVSQSEAAPRNGAITPDGPWIVGFYTAGLGQRVSEIPWRKITHLHLCCAAPGPNGNLAENWLQPASYSSIRSLARANYVKLVLSIYAESSVNNWFSNTSPDLIDAFVKNIAAYITSNDFDGVDLDWEGEVNAFHYIRLITKLRSALPYKFLSIDVYNPGSLVTVAAESYSSLDQVNVMCYDMAKGHRVTWHNSALFQAGDVRLMACDWRIGAFVEAGVPKAKLGIGIPAYGYVWNGATEPLHPGAILSDKQWPYNQIVRNPTWWNSGLNTRWDDIHKATAVRISQLTSWRPQLARG